VLAGTERQFVGGHWNEEHALDPPSRGGRVCFARIVMTFTLGGNEMPATLTIQDYQKTNPCRTAAWRHDHVVKLLEARPRPRQPSRLHDDSFIHKYHDFLLRYQRAASEEVRRALFADYKPIWLAHSFYMNADCEGRALLEARYLSRESDERIAERTGFLADAIAWYEKLFFNVRDRLDARDWVVKTIRDTAGRRRRGSDALLSEREIGQFYRLLGYFGGPLILDHAIGALSARPPRQGSEVDDWFNDELHSCIRQLAVLSVTEVALSNAIHLFRVHIKLSKGRTMRSKPALSIKKNLKHFWENLPWAIAPRQP